METERLKKCNVCEALKPLSEYYPDKHRSGGLMRYCRLCNSVRCRERRLRDKQKHNDAVRRWRLANPEEAAAINARSREKNREKAIQRDRLRYQRKANGSRYTQTQWEDLCQGFGNKCLKCSATGVLLTIDHIIPLSKGGIDDLSNIQPLCRSCNSAKGAWHSTDYRPKQAG